MGGGGGTYWVVDRIHNTVAVSFSQSFGGRGHSTDAAKDESAIDGILVKMLKRNELTPNHHRTPTERYERDWKRLSQVHTSPTELVYEMLRTFGVFLFFLCVLQNARSWWSWCDPISTRTLPCSLKPLWRKGILPQSGDGWSEKSGGILGTGHSFRVSTSLRRGPRAPLLVPAGSMCGQGLTDSCRCSGSASSQTGLSEQKGWKLKCPKNG